MPECFLRYCAFATATLRLWSLFGCSAGDNNEQCWQKWFFRRRIEPKLLYVELKPLKGLEINGIAKLFFPSDQSFYRRNHKDRSHLCREHKKVVLR